jgi:hypothetical protein
MSEKAGITEFKLIREVLTGEIKARVEFTVKHPADRSLSEGELKNIHEYADYVSGILLGKAESKSEELPRIPHFDPEELMKHQGWKAKKKADGGYEDGSLNFGWDFVDKFPESVRQALADGKPLQIDEYEFTSNGTIISVHKRKEKK